MEKPNLEKLSMLDEYGHRISIHPADVRGFFRKNRTWTQVVLIFVFLVLPWIQVRGHQALLLDIPNRRFAFFGVTFWAHDAPMVFFILGIAALTLVVVTALWGRVWCGWSCPQTVFIDGVYRRIETWIEGDYRVRRASESSPLTFLLFVKKLLKWLVFLVVSSVLAHSFAAYFVGAESLVKMIQNSPLEHWGLFLFVVFLTLLFTFNFGWFREQFCIIMCPYGRFQSVLLDSHSVTVMYDAKRGEPRRGRVPSTTPVTQEVGIGLTSLASSNPGAGSGDCVDCGRCVQVCPTGIDIRNGSQMECIACTACIDACDEIMEKVHKPTGLIRYMSLLQKSRPRFTARIGLYLSVLVLLIGTFTGLLWNRKPLHVQVTRARETPYTQTLSAEGEPLVINHFRLSVVNQTFETQWIYVLLNKENESKGLDLKIPNVPLEMNPGQFKDVHFFIVFPKSLASVTEGSMPSTYPKVNLRVQSLSDQEHKSFVQSISSSQFANEKGLQTIEIDLVGP